MSDRPGVPVIPLPRGVVWRSRKEGEGGKSFAEFAVTTPRFPNYITTTELRDLSKAVQAETALFWFYENLEPYDTSRVALGFGSRPHADVALYPDAMSSDHALSAALGAGLDRGVHDRLVAALPGVWMWRRDVPPITSLDDVLARLDDLATAIRQITPRRGQMGHNELSSTTTAEHDAALRSIEGLKTSIGTGAVIDLEAAYRQVEQVSAFIDRSGNYALGLCDAFLQGVASEAGKTVGKYIVGAIAAYALWKGILPDLNHLLAQHGP